jgi:hypothetical protein
MVLDMKVTGLTINSMDMVKNHGLMELYTKVNILMVKNMDTVIFVLLILQYMKELLVIILLKVREHIFGMMVKNMLVSGKITKCKVMVNWTGLTINIMKDNLLQIKEKEKALLFGVMEESMMVIGSQGNNME